MADKNSSTFQERISLDLSKDIKTKEGGKDKQGNITILSYLSWASAQKIMKIIDDESQIIEHEFDHYRVVSGQHQDFLVTEQKPYRLVGDGAMVKVSVILFGKTETENYPVTNYRGQAILKPTSSDINTALKRAFVKALAKHGIGLYLYEGEDLPEPQKITAKELEVVEKILLSLNEETGNENEQTIIATINKYSEQEPRYGGKIKKLNEMTYEQEAIFKVTVGKIRAAFEKEAKKK